MSDRNHRNHAKQAGKWIPDDRVLKRLEGSGFEYVCKFDLSYNITTQLSSLMQRHFDYVKLGFKINNETISPTLDDVARLLGLPIDGEPVVTKELDHDQAVQITKDLLGDEGLIDGKGGRDLNLNKLRNTFMGVTGSDDDSSVDDKYVRAYVLYLLGTFYLPSRNDRCVPAMYLSLLRNVDNIKTYAWGAAVLCHTLHQMRLCATNNHSHSANLHFLEFFLFEYVPELVTTIFPQVEETPKTFPLVSYYSKKLVRFSRNSFLHQVFGQRLDNIFEHGVIMWQPYPTLDHLIPDHLKTQLRSALSCTALLAFNEVEYHRPENFPKKFGLQEVIRHTLPRLHKPISRRSSSTTDWSLKHSHYVNIWRSKSEFYIVRGDVLDEMVQRDVAVHGNEQHEEGSAWNQGDEPLEVGRGCEDEVHTDFIGETPRSFPERSPPERRRRKRLKG